MGLGYTALGAARKVGPTGRVVTIEYDEASIEMAAHNPWSQGLFDDTLPVEILQGTSKDEEEEERSFVNLILPPATLTQRNPNPKHPNCR